jgi:hypothetical protein
MSAWHTLLQCQWQSWHAINDHDLALYLPDMNCCSMNGATTLAMALMPDVLVVRVYVGGDPDTYYVRRSTDSPWEARIQSRQERRH